VLGWEGGYGEGAGGMYSGRGGWPCPAVLSPCPRPTPFFPPPTRRRTALNTKNTPQPLFISSLVQPDKSKRQRAVKYRYPPTCLRRDFQCVTEGRSLRVFVVVAWQRRSADRQLASRGTQKDERGRAIIRRPRVRSPAGRSVGTAARAR
jgi:hypothetical protein